MRGLGEEEEEGGQEKEERRSGKVEGGWMGAGHGFHHIWEEKKKGGGGRERKEAAAAKELRESEQRFSWRTKKLGFTSPARSLGSVVRPLHPAQAESQMSVLDCAETAGCGGGRLLLFQHNGVQFQHKSRIVGGNKTVLALGKPS